MEAHCLTRYQFIHRYRRATGRRIIPHDFDALMARAQNETEFRPEEIPEGCGILWTPCIMSRFYTVFGGEAIAEYRGHDNISLAFIDGGEVYYTFLCSRQSRKFTPPLVKGEDWGWI